MTRRCFGVTRSFRRCGRIDGWLFFCPDHRFQPIVLLCFMVFTVGGGIASIQSAWFAKRVAAPLRADEFHLRFVIQNPDITEQTLKNAPDAVHCTGRIGVPSVDFDMRKLPTIVHEMSRSRSLPEIAYKADNFQFRSLELLNRQGLAGNTFRFPFPYELRNVAGSSSSYNVELFVRDQWYFTGYNSFDSGTVEIPLRQPQR